MLLAIAGVAAYVATIYNSLVQVKHNVDQSWANIDVLLKQRGDELGKLIDSVKGYLAYERDLLTRLTTLRSQMGRGGPDESRLAAEREIGAGVGRIFALAENYPDLKSSGNFLELQRRITGLEEQIAHRREFYNDAVNINNSRMEQVPDRLLAGAAGLQRRPLFEATAEERADIDVGARLTGITAWAGRGAVMNADLTTNDRFARLAERVEELSHALDESRRQLQRVERQRRWPVVFLVLGCAWAGMTGLSAQSNPILPGRFKTPFEVVDPNGRTILSVEASQSGGGFVRIGNPNTGGLTLGVGASGAGYLAVRAANGVNQASIGQAEGGPMALRVTS
ncbi:MAG TPA: LemA family protein, partial [Vicinamibacterales bacterium]|nr:LemA family protein [Vicinamibacterales bacterium]